MEQAIIGVFGSQADATKAREALYSAGIAPTNVKNAGPEIDGVEEGGIAGFFQTLFGTDEHPHVGHYSTAAERGNAIVMVQAHSDDEAARAVSIMDSYGAIDVEDQAKQWQDEGQTEVSAVARTQNSKAATENQKIPVVEEQLEVGKRKVDRGGVRIYMRESERPVEETINLREERVIIERRPIQRQATAADLNTAKERVFEVRTTGEEPVVSKTARVVEEVVIGRQTTERQETVKDTVRRTDVEVENIDKAGSPRRGAGKI